MIIFWIILLVALAIISGIVGFSSRLPDGAIVAGRALSAVFVVAALVVLYQGAIAGF